MRLAFVLALAGYCAVGVNTLSISSCCMEGNVCTLGTIGCQVTANVQSGRASDRCTLNADADEACNEVVTLTMTLSGEDVEEDDEIALVPTGSCTDAFLAGIDDLYFSTLTSSGSNSSGTWTSLVRAPWTHGDHIVCVRHKLIASSEPATVQVDCPANWYARGSGEPERAADATREGGTRFVVSTFVPNSASNETSLTFREARDACAALGSGARLCTLSELEHGEGSRLSSSSRVWTSTECTLSNDEGSITGIGFWTMASNSPCAYADCAPSYPGQRCWHDAKRSLPCTTYDPSDPSTRASCPSDTDWRLAGTNVSIPAWKEAGKCDASGSALCGNMAGYTVSDGAMFMGGEACSTLNVSDVSSSGGNGAYENHGAAPKVCVALDESILDTEAVCCRGEMPTCSLCPFGYTSEVGSKGIESCSQCEETCGHVCETSCGVMTTCSTSEATVRENEDNLGNQDTLCKCETACSAQGLCDVNQELCGLANNSQTLLLRGGSSIGGFGLEPAPVVPSAFCDDVVNGTDALSETCCSWEDAYYYSASRDAMLIPVDPFATTSSSTNVTENSIEVIGGKSYRVVRQNEGPDLLGEEMSQEECSE